MKLLITTFLVALALFATRFSSGSEYDSLGDDVSETTVLGDGAGSADEPGSDWGDNESDDSMGADA